MTREIVSKPTLRVFQDYLVSYNTVRGIEELFEDANIMPLEGYDPGESSVRRNIIKQYYASLDLRTWNDVKKLLRVYEQILLQLQLDIKQWNQDNLQKELDRLTEYLKRDGLSFKDAKLVYDGDPSIFNNEGGVDESELPVFADLFEYQFPAGLPFGLSKPNFAVVAEKGVQRLRFELKAGMGILRKDVYPNLTFGKLASAFDGSLHVDTTIRHSLVGMNQTESERAFFLAYARTFNMATANVPALIPQAWVQWHSTPKTNLRSTNSLHADDLYRIDFVTFWSNRRYAILIDDIGHYAKKHQRSWLADEESYSKRLKEDRKLRKERWQVFRVSNWEIRNTQLLPEILSDLREFMGFE